MSHSGTHISAPVRILADLQPVIGTTRRGIQDICANETKVNKWAKYKGTRAIGAQKPTDYWKGRVNDNPQTCALAQPISSSIANFMTSLAAGSYAWTYLRPRGQQYDPKEWCRETDFDGYEHSAICPLPVAPSGTVTYSSMHTFICSLPTTFPVGNLLLSDLYVSTISGEPSLESCYIGLLLYSGSTRKWVTADQTIAQGKGTAEQKHLKVAMDLTGMTGTWYARTFLSTGKLSLNQVTGGAYCIACEGVGTLTLTHISGDYSVTLEAKWLSNSQYKVTAHFINGKSTAVSVTNMRIVVNIQLDSRTITIPNQTIVAGQEYQYFETYNYIYAAGATATASGNFGGTTKTASANFVNP